MSPLISVILPVYNQEKYIAQTIDSVLKQALTDFELLLHDDGSSDGSAAIIRQYAARDPRIRASFASNAGRCAATNALVAQAKGIWCALIDADDVMLPERLATQLAYHQANPHIDATSCHCHYIDTHGQHMGTQRYPGLRTSEEGRQAYNAGQYILCAITGVMVRRKVYIEIGGLRSQFWPCDDVDFSNRLVERNFTLVIIPKVLMLYRIHANSVTMSSPWHALDMVDYTTCCLALRRAGKAEIPFAEFMRERQFSPWWVKLNRRRYSYSSILQRRAGFYLYTKNYLRFSILMSTALLLSPALGFATIRKGLAHHIFLTTDSL